MWRINSFFLSALGISLWLQAVPAALADASLDLTSNLVARVSGDRTALRNPNGTQAQITIAPRDEENTLPRGEHATEQPSLDACTTESWAKHEEGNESSCVTQWYFDQFFKAPKENGLEDLARAAGLDVNEPLITFRLEAQVRAADVQRGATSLAPDKIRELMGILEHFKTLFALDAGRLLAWRTLIEIYRPESAEAGICLLSAKARTERLASRYLEVELGPKSNFTPSNGAKRCRSCMKLAAQSSVNKQTVQGKGYTQTYAIDADGVAKPMAISIGHEWLHWFHALRNPERFEKDRSGNRGASGFFLSDGTISSFVFAGLYDTKEEDFEARKTRSMSPWTGTSAQLFLCGIKEFYSHEEHLTVCGAAIERIDHKKFFWGDELSENRLIVSYNRLHAAQLAIRAGHSNFPFFEDERVIKSICRCCEFPNESPSVGPRGLGCASPICTEVGLGHSRFLAVRNPS